MTENKEIVTNLQYRDIYQHSSKEILVRMLRRCSTFLNGLVPLRTRNI